VVLVGLDAEAVREGLARGRVDVHPAHQRGVYLPESFRVRLTDTTESDDSDVHGCDIAHELVRR